MSTLTKLWLIVGILLIVAGVVCIMLKVAGAIAISLCAIGAFIVLTMLIRRFGGRGSFSRSGWSG